MSHNQQQSSGFGSLVSGAENLFGGSQSSSIGGGHPQQQNQFSEINKTIDAGQAMMGHTGTGGPGFQGYIDQAQGLTGYKPAGGVQGALNTAQGMQNLQKLSGEAQKSGLGNLTHTAEGLLGQQQGQHGTTQGGVGGFVNQAEGLLGKSTQQTGKAQQGSGLGGEIGSINSTVDSAQAMMGHTGQGGPGFQGTIDKGQSYLTQAEQFAGGTHGQTGNIANTATRNVTNTANTATRNVANTANTAARDVPQKKKGGLHGFFDKAKGLFGHHHSHTDTA